MEVKVEMKRRKRGGKGMENQGSYSLTSKTHFIFNHSSFSYIAEKIDEARLVVQALRVNTLSKLTFSDSARFDNLVKDVFPGIDMKDIEYQNLAQAIRDVCTTSNLIPMETQVSLHHCSLHHCI